MPTTKLKNGQLPDTISSKTVDNTNDINTTTTRLKITGGSNGQVLSTDGSGNLSWTTAGGGGTGSPTEYIVKSADETITSSTTFQNDDHLTTTLDANSYYQGRFELFITRSNTSSTPNAKHSIQASSLGIFGHPSISPAQFAVCDGSAQAGAMTTPSSISSVGTQIPVPTTLFFTIKTGGSPVTLTYRWAQSASNATGLVVMKGSYLMLWKTATV